MKGHIRERGEGTWAIIIDLGRDADGKRRQKWHTVKGGKRDAQRELTRLLNELHTGGYVEPSKLTVGAYLQRWLADYAKTNVADKTYEGYEEFIRVHLTPALGRHLLTKLSPIHIQSYYSQALQSGRRDGKGGLSARTVLHHHRVLREALHHAVKWQLLARNPADAVEPPRAVRKEMSALDEAQTAQLLASAAGTRLYLPILLAVCTGMRRGEVLGLRWADVDLKNGSLAVRQTLVRTKAGDVFKAPKTAKGRRVVSLPSLMVDFLATYKGEQAQARLLLGDAYQPLGLVVANPDGSPFSPNAFTHSFTDLMAKLDLPRVRLHDLRHGHATQLLRQGIHPKVVSERLGHSNIGITLDTYSHVLPDMQEEAARRMDTALRAAVDAGAAPARPTALRVASGGG